MPRAGPLAAALLAVAPLALAGCLAGAHATDSRDAQGHAVMAALRWDPEARLVAVAAVDPGEHAMDELRDDVERADRDGADEAGDGGGRGGGGGEEDGEDGDGLDRLLPVHLLRAVVAAGGTPAGDGKAPAWAYFFQEPGGAGYVVVVRGSAVVHAGEHELDEQALPLRGVRIDSVEAADAAAEADPRFAELRGRHDAAAVMFLVQDGEREGAEDGDGDADEPPGGAGHPLWLLFLGPAGNATGDGSIVLVDAVNGTAVPLSSILRSWMNVFLGTREEGADEGLFLGGPGQTADVQFGLAQAHEVLVARLEVTPPPVVPVRATLTAPDGREATFEVGLQADATAHASTALAAPGNGTYTVHLDAPLAPAARWSLSWCTDGTVGIWDWDLLGQGPAACDEVPRSASTTRA